MQTWTFDSPNPDRTREMGAALGRSIGRDGLILGLVGPLGAGKTVFVKGLAEGLGVDSRLVSSPTFVIAQEYPLAGGGPETLHHIDLYRLESEDELEAIGFFDMLAPGQVLAVEWADRFEGVLGRKLLMIELEGPSASEADASERAKESTGMLGLEASAPPVRTARMTAMGEAAQHVLQDFAERAEALASSAAPSGASVGGRAADGGRSTSPEMRLIHMLCLCLAGLAWIGLGSDSVDGLTKSMSDRWGLARGSSGCRPGESLVRVEEDALGTLRASCAWEDPLALHDRALAGVGRLVSGERIDLTRASSALLQTLPGIGPTRAAAILASRERGLLQIPSDLERVPGIGRKTRQRLERWIELRAPRSQRTGG